MSLRQFSRTIVGILIAFTVACLTAMNPTPALSGTRMQADTDLPPRPTQEPPVATPNPEESGASAVASFIRLDTTLPADWPWTARHWQSLHTQVQWQDACGTWVDVEGWYGAHDLIEVAEDGSATATKIWWIAEENYGTGPFRWLVTDETDTVLLQISEPFTLPTRSPQTVIVKIGLTE